jgi:hypothetical protein
MQVVVSKSAKKTLRTAGQAVDHIPGLDQVVPVLGAFHVAKALRENFFAHSGYCGSFWLPLMEFVGSVMQSDMSTRLYLITLVLVTYLRCSKLSMVC